MANHYITIDEKNRIIDGFSDFYRQPEYGDILLRSDGGQEFELFGKDPNRHLWMSTPNMQGVKVYLYAYDNGQTRYRTDEELNADIPPLPYTPTVEERLDTAEYNIETLDRVLIIMLGGDPDA